MNETDDIWAPLSQAEGPTDEQLEQLAHESDPDIPEEWKNKPGYINAVRIVSQRQLQEVIQTALRSNQYIKGQRAETAQGPVDYVVLYDPQKVNFGGEHGQA